jgi:UDP-glucose 4-epimerase
MRFFVTGATGFVGRAVLERLAEDGASVRVAVRARVDAPLDQVVVPSIDARTDWRGALEGSDVVIHLAARVHQLRDAASAREAYDATNAAGTLALAEAAAAAGVRRFVFVSTVKVHGENRGVAFDEGDVPVPSDPYGVSKLRAERLLAELEQRSDLEVVVLRPPLVYGPGVKANFLRLVKLVDKGWPLPFASFRNSRSLLGVRNLADALCSSATNAAASGRTFLVSDGEDVSTPELIRRIAAQLGKRARLVPFPVSWMSAAARKLGRMYEFERMAGDMVVDSRRIRRVLGWAPRWTMDDELAETIAWYRNGVPRA